MLNMALPFPGKNVEVLVPLLESQVIPCCEWFGLDRVAVTFPTQKEFEAQALPAAVRATPKPRTGKKASKRGRRVFNNAGSFLESWPDDDQALFRYPTLIFVLEGQADFHIGDYMVHCPQDHFLLFRSNVPRPIGERPHLASENTEHGHCTVLWFFAPPGTNSVSASICYSKGSRHWKEGDSGYCALHRPEVVHVFKLLMQELEELPAASPKIVHLSLQTFLQLFLREVKEGRFHRAGVSVLPEAQMVDETTPIERAQQYIKTHLGHHLTSTNVAQEVYMSRNTFLKHFTRETGQTFNDYVVEQRMAEAHRLLSEGYCSIAFVCQYVGLRPTQLRAQFKKHFGISPSALRDAAQKKVQNR